MINREKLATRLFEAFDNKYIGRGEEQINLDDIINGGQKYSLIMHILSNIPLSSHEKVKEFSDTFEVTKETSLDVTEFTQSELRFRLLLEEVLELGASLNFSKGKIYEIYVELQEKVFKKGIKPSLIEVFDALIDIAYVMYGAIDAFNLNEIFDDGMEEVHDSNMSKVLPISVSPSEIKFNIDTLQSDGTQVVSKILQDKYIVFLDKNTNKILKPITYTKSNLEPIINKLNSKL
jgi:predicted HAD superfamily Cof-like phosphohydrolase